MNSVVHVVDGGSGRVLTKTPAAVLRWLMDHPNRLHHKDDIARAIDVQAGDRAIDTHISTVRKALGDFRDRIVIGHGRGSYGWIGDPVALIPVSRASASVRDRAGTVPFAVISREEVARRLGISESEVGKLENSAFAKLRKNPKLRDLFDVFKREMHGRLQYNPCYEVWLFDVRGSLNP